MKQMLIQLTNSTTTTFGLWNKSIQRQPATALKSRFWVMTNLTTFGNRPAVLTEIFPHLFTQGRGYYNLANAQGDPHTSDEPGEDSEVIVEHNMQNTKDHLRARVIGAAKAAYFLCGWSKHRNSRRVIFINTSLEGHDVRRLL
ncbi:unnamed protein product [Mucor circinelloides]